jgi:hypothetical protein
MSSTTRNPQVRRNDTATAAATDTTVDIIANNFLHRPGDALTVRKARAHVSGNYGPVGSPRGRTERGPFDALSWRRRCRPRDRRYAEPLVPGRP